MFEWTRPPGWATACGHYLWPGTDASPSVSPCACGRPGLTTASGHCSGQQNSLSSGPAPPLPLLLPARTGVTPQQGLRATLILGTGGSREQSEAVCAPGRRGGGSPPVSPLNREERRQLQTRGCFCRQSPQPSACRGLGVHMCPPPRPRSWSEGVDSPPRGTEEPGGRPFLKTRRLLVTKRAATRVRHDIYLFPQTARVAALASKPWSSAHPGYHLAFPLRKRRHRHAASSSRRARGPAAVPAPG